MPRKRCSKFLTEQEIVAVIQKKLSDGSSLSAGVAFWGRGAAAELNIDTKNSHQIEIVCNLRMGGTNPAAIEELQKLGAKIKHRDDLHAKVYIFDDSVIIGSSNASANGLAFQAGEAASWREANILTDDPEIVSKTKAWFSEISSQALAVRPSDLKRAKEAWSRRRAQIPIHARNLYEAVRTNPKLFEGHRIHISIWNEEASPEAEKALKTFKKNTSLGATNKIDCYEGWDDMPEDITIIDFFGNENGVELQGIYQTPRSRISVPLKNGSIQICFERKSVNGLSLGNKKAWERAALKAAKNNETFIDLYAFATKYLA